MSGQFIGMDIGQVRELAQLFTAKADEIGQLSQAVTTKLGATQWVGNDRTLFDQEWTKSQTALQGVATLLSDSALKATNNANEQEQASSK